ncbi:uncharacterized protein EI97DRAFT_31528 [Westerdykella ornata]|uniref:Uncharacterized protein n=1 Tax=Westerdykella ornata TaxID=318751 RepID=A0A6A6JY32_WESOR|nr:uncharacterized protein EI97DRAFT_31528 [Westerdykella ornata]KAF2281512.1 hypothetical protein EI97DRAFT_31528 [Westerdykella ornata]
MNVTAISDIRMSSDDIRVLYPAARPQFALHIPTRSPGARFSLSQACVIPTRPLQSHHLHIAYLPLYQTSPAYQPISSSFFSIPSSRLPLHVPIIDSLHPSYPFPVRPLPTHPQPHPYPSPFLLPSPRHASPKHLRTPTHLWTTPPHVPPTLPWAYSPQSRLRTSYRSPRVQRSKLRRSRSGARAQSNMPNIPRGRLHKEDVQGCRKWLPGVSSRRRFALPRPRRRKDSGCGTMVPVLPGGGGSLGSRWWSDSRRLFFADSPGACAERRI